MGRSYRGVIHAQLCTRAPSRQQLLEFKAFQHQASLVAQHQLLVGLGWFMHRDRLELQHNADTTNFL